MSYGFCADHTLRSWFNAVTAVRQAVGRLKYSGFSSTKGWNHSNWIVLWHFKNTDRIRSRIKSNQVISGWQERNCPWYAAFSHFIIALHSRHSIQASKVSSWHMLLLMFYFDLSHVDVVRGPSRNQTDSGGQMPAVHHTLWWHEQKWYIFSCNFAKQTKNWSQNSSRPRLWATQQFSWWAKASASDLKISVGFPRVVAYHDGSTGTMMISCFPNNHGSG